MDDNDEHTYGNVGDLKTGTRRDEPTSQPLGRFSSPYRAAAVCLGLLCVLLLAGIIGLWFYHTNHDYNNLTQRDILQTSYNNLTKERDQLETNKNKLIEERDLLQSSNNNLTVENHELQRRFLDAATCPTGWGMYNSRCYYISTMKKTWNESRQDCLSRGADLVIIKSIEEQRFVTEFNKRAWIGLTDTEVEGTWKWVDGTPLNSSFWNSPRQPDNGGGDPAFGEEDCGETSDKVYGWNDLNCNEADYWICEKKMFVNCGHQKI